MCVQRWMSLFNDPTRWWDNRGKTWKNYPDFKHAVSGEGLFLSSLPQSLQPMLQRLNPPSNAPGGVRASFAQAQLKNGPERSPVLASGSDKKLSDLFQARNKLLAELKQCQDPVRGRKLHSKAETEKLLNKYVATALITMYSRCGKTDEARVVLDDNRSMVHGQVVAWNAMILGYAQSNENEMALELFSSMPRSSGCEPDARSFVAALKACAGLALKEEPKQVGGKAMKQTSLERGIRIHSQAEERGFASTDLYVQTTLVDMYAKCLELSRARGVFEKMKLPRNVVAWNAMILGCIENGRSAAALEMFHRSRAECMPNETSYAAALRACSSVMAVEAGRELHGEINGDSGLRSSKTVAACLVDFYSKCGNMMDVAQEVFNSAPESSRDSAVWNALLSGYSQEGDFEKAWKVFQGMVERGLVNGITFIFMLTACSHSGSVGKAEELFGEMESRYRVAPTVEHLTCMVDMYGRSNRFEEALGLMRGMRGKFGFEPDVILWRTLLGACRKWKNVGRLAFESLVKLDEELSAAYVLMAGIYAGNGMLAEQNEILKRRSDVKAWKKPGQTWWTEDGGKVHSFVIGRRDHPQHDQVVRKVDEIMGKIKVEGYVADATYVFDEDDGEVDGERGSNKEEVLCGHSEKLAVACALINSKPGSVIRIVKNLRVCDDCHRATALISKVENREIVCRDAGRLHVLWMVVGFRSSDPDFCPSDGPDWCAVVKV